MLAEPILLLARSTLKLDVLALKLRGKLRVELRNFLWLCMFELMKGWGGDPFLVDFGLREYHFGLFEALAGHELQLVTAVDEVIKLVDIRIILFLDLTDLPRNVPEPHFHPLHLSPSTVLLPNTPPLLLRTTPSLFLV